VPIAVEARIAAVIAVGDPIGDLPTANGDLERLGRGAVPHSGASPADDLRAAIPPPGRDTVAVGGDLVDPCAPELARQGVRGDLAVVRRVLLPGARGCVLRRPWSGATGTARASDVSPTALAAPAAGARMGRWITCLSRANSGKVAVPLR
jgi:hypothetical protein